MRTIIYTRVSTEDQGDNFSLGTQLDACRRYAAQHDLRITAECVDAATGSTLDRPGLTKVRQIIAAGGCDALVAYQQDRLSRNLAHTLLLRDELHSAAEAEAEAVRQIAGWYLDAVPIAGAASDRHGMIWARSTSVGVGVAASEARRNTHNLPQWLSLTTSVP